MRNSADRLNWINVGLMLVACAAAMVAPFHVFLFAYAVLGPLHYLTEISWLHDRSFFTSSRGRRSAWLLLVGATAVVMTAGFVSTELLDRPVAPTVEIGLFLLVFVAAGVVSYVRHPVNAVAVIGLGGAGIYVFSAYPMYGILAYLLMTIVHVFVFTGLFLVAGATKTRSRSGYVSFAVFLTCAAAAFFAGVPFRDPGATVRTIYAGFEPLNGLLQQWTHGSAAGVMRFIAFAYTYHYLNWFSKTSVIRWHEVSRTRGAAILGAWAAAVGMYAYSYRLGFASLYVLSVVHVMLEFPLNHQTLVNVVRACLPAAQKKRGFAGAKPLRA